LAKCGFAERKFFWLAVKVGEIAASAAGDQDFLSEAIGVFEDGDAAAALAGFDGAHQSGRAASENECIEGVDQSTKTSGAKARINRECFTRPIRLRQDRPLKRRSSTLQQEFVTSMHADFESHIEQTQTWDVVFFQKTLVDVLPL